MEYWWPYLEPVFKTAAQAKRTKLWVRGALTLLVCFQAYQQVVKDRQADQDTAYLKSQLDKANVSLTNVTMVARGLATGGDSEPEFTLTHTGETNVLSLYMESSGEYPLRMLKVMVKDKTKRINGDPGRPNVKLDAVEIYDRFLGDFPPKSECKLCDVRLDPAVTNYLRFDVSAMNGSYWQILAVSKTNDAWKIWLHYRWSRFGGKLQIDPPSKRNGMMIDD